MLWKLRVLIFYAILSVLSILFALFTCVPFLFIKVPYRVRYGVGYTYSYLFIHLARLICGLRYKVIGLSKLPKVPFIALSNHQSFWENMFMQLIIPIHSWVIKKELLKTPLLGLGLKMVEAIAVDRSAHTSVKQILDNGKKKLALGLSMVIFPESTRVLPEKNVRFKPSAAKLALEARVPVVLIVHNSGIYWPKQFWIKKPGVITVKVIEVMDVKDIEQHDARSLTDYIEVRINTEKKNLIANHKH